MDPAVGVIGTVVAYAGGIEGCLPASLAGPGTPATLPGREGNRQLAVDWWVDDDFVGDRVANIDVEEAKGVGGME